MLKLKPINPEIQINVVYYIYFFRINSVLKTVQSYGDYEKLSQGVFENYLTLKHKDSSLTNVC